MEGVLGPMKMDRRVGSVKAVYSQCTISRRSWSVVARVRIKGPVVMVGGGMVVSSMNGLDAGV